jgi:phosphopantetheinyl transferase
VPLFYQQDINETTRMAVWKIAEPEAFFLSAVPLRRDITHPHKRLQHLAGRYLLRFLFPDFPNEEIAIADTRKPFLPDEQYHFSISHCGDFAAAIVSADHRVGVDIEIVTPRVEKIKHKFLHPDERVFVEEMPRGQQVPLLTLLWSCKEAMFKWWGTGDVDFSEALRIARFDFNTAGEIGAQFQKNEFQFPLALHYKMVENMSLAWVVSPPIKT